MKSNSPRLQLIIEGPELQAFYAIASEFQECGKAGTIGFLLGSGKNQNFKFNDADFLCVYSSISRVLDGHRYPAKVGNEYMALCRLKTYFEEQYLKQRNQTL